MQILFVLGVLCVTKPLGGEKRKCSETGEGDGFEFKRVDCGRFGMGCVIARVAEAGFAGI